MMASGRKPSMHDRAITSRKTGEVVVGWAKQIGTQASGCTPACAPKHLGSSRSLPTVPDHDSTKTTKRRVSGAIAALNIALEDCSPEACVAAVRLLGFQAVVTTSGGCGYDGQPQDVMAFRDNMKARIAACSESEWANLKEHVEAIVLRFCDEQEAWTRRRKSLRHTKLGMRFAVLERDGFRCVYCGRTSKDVTLHVDHAISVFDGGPTTPENLVTACSDCNLGKHKRSVDPAVVR